MRRGSKLHLIEYTDSIAQAECSVEFFKLAMEANALPLIQC